VNLANGVFAEPFEEWIKTLADGRKVKFIHQEPPEYGTFITAHLADNEVFYPVVSSAARNPLSHEEVEGHSADDFQKSSNTQLGHCLF
jgi:hypothetical protein